MVLEARAVLEGSSAVVIKAELVARLDSAAARAAVAALEEEVADSAEAAAEVVVVEAVASAGVGAVVKAEPKDGGVKWQAHSLGTAAGVNKQFMAKRRSLCRIRR